MSKRLEFINSLLEQNEQLDFQVFREEYDSDLGDFIEVGYDVSYLLDGHEYGDINDVLDEIEDTYPEEYREIIKNIEEFDEENEPKIDKYKEALKTIIDTGNYQIIVDIDYVSRNGMTRFMVFTMCYIDKENRIQECDVTNLIAEILDCATNKGSLVVHGTGMDMVASVISYLSYKLYGDEYKIDYSKVTVI
jgi:hypothetical protein